jgi:hypothetical protein
MAAANGGELEAARVGHPFPPIAAGSDLVGVPCAACRRRLAQRDVIRAMVTTSAEVDAGVALEAAFVHVDCSNPRGEIESRT